MPNCDFYATYEDHKLILDFILDGSQCEIYELSSDFEKPLKQFTSTDQILKEFDRTYSNGNKWSSVYLQLHVLDSGSEFNPRKVNLNPEKCNGFKYRYSAEGFGLVQLYLEVPSNNLLSNSHTNHNSQKRAEKWARTEDDLKEVEALDFEKITKFSSKLNRFIRNQSIGKLLSRPVLPSAYKLWKDDFNFGPYSPSQHELKLK